MTAPAAPGREHEGDRETGTCLECGRAIIRVHWLPDFCWECRQAGYHMEFDYPR